MNNNLSNFTVIIKIMFYFVNVFKKLLLNFNIKFDAYLVS